MDVSRHSQEFSFLPELRPRIGELLLDRGLISADELARALARKEPGEKLGAALVRLEIVFEHDLVRTLASQCGLGYLDLFTHGVDAGVARLLPRAIALELDAIPVRASTGGSVVVAVADPLEIDVPELQRAIGAPVELKVAELSAIRQRLETIWPPESAPEVQQEAAGPADADPAVYTVHVADPGRTADVAAYLARLGAEAGVTTEGVVTVAVGSLYLPDRHDERAELVQYLGAWSAAHGTRALLSL